MLDRFEFSLTGFIFGFVGIGVSLSGLVVLKNAKASTSWPTVQGEVIESRVTTSTNRNSDGGSSTSYHAQVDYRYEVEDVEYVCDSVSFGQYGTNNSKRARETVKRYPKGKKVTVHYDPEKPKTAVLEPGVTWSSYMLLGVGLICAGVGGCCFYSRR